MVSGYNLCYQWRKKFKLASLGACTVYGKLLEGERYDIGLQKDYLKLIYDMLKTEKNPQ